MCTDFQWHLYDPSADFVALSATLAVVAVVLTSGFTPRPSSRESDDNTDEFDYRTFS